MTVLCVYFNVTATERCQAGKFQFKLSFLPNASLITVVVYAKFTQHSWRRRDLLKLVKTLAVNLTMKFSVFLMAKEERKYLPKTINNGKRKVSLVWNSIICIMFSTWCYSLQLVENFSTVPYVNVYS